MKGKWTDQRMRRNEREAKETRVKGNEVKLERNKRRSVS